MWEDKFIDILMIILDHSPWRSSTAIQHTLVSSGARPMSHLSGRRKWVRVDIKIKDARRETAWRADRACQVMFVSEHDLQRRTFVPPGAWEVWLWEQRYKLLSLHTNNAKKMSFWTLVNTFWAVPVQKYTTQCHNMQFILRIRVWYPAGT